MVKINGSFDGLCASKRILIIDDEEAVQIVTKMILEEFGYIAECVGNDAEGIQLFRHRKEQKLPFIAVIVDLNIPGGMGAERVMSDLLMIDPDVRGILASGNHGDPIMKNYQNYGFKGSVKKPYRALELVETVKKVLASPLG